MSTILKDPHLIHTTRFLEDAYRTTSEVYLYLSITLLLKVRYDC